MSRIRSKDTKPELLVRKYLFSRGRRSRVNVSRIPGHPDIVLPKYNALIEVRGCFWHRHEGCKAASTPMSNVEFCNAKFNRNVVRDKKEQTALEKAGWRVIVIWECQVQTSIHFLFQLITQKLEFKNVC